MGDSYGIVIYNDDNYHGIIIKHNHIFLDCTCQQNESPAHILKMHVCAIMLKIYVANIFFYFSCLHKIAMQSFWIP